MIHQAKLVSDALKSIGLKHGSWRSGGDFTVRTDITRRYDKASGRTYPEYGTARARIENKARATVEANAQVLADKGFSVTLVYVKDELVTTIVSSDYNRGNRVSVFNDDGWSKLPLPEAVAC